MDLVTYEAPLDNSFQKDRRELVSKGSLGRRRKPSRSNLRLILSPANDRQVFHDRQDGYSSDRLIQVKASSALPNGKDSTLDNHLESVTRGKCSRSGQSESSALSEADNNNYREVVASINQLSNLRSVDLNGNNHQVSAILRHQNTASPVNHFEIIRIKQQNSRQFEKNGLKSDDHQPVSVIHNQQNNRNHKPWGKTENGSYEIKSNGCLNSNSSKIQKAVVSINNQKAIKNSNQQKTVASKNHLNIITFSNHRQIITSSPIEPKKPTASDENHRHLNSYPNPSSKQLKESRLPRTSKESNLVAEAQQFSIEAKRKRKKSEVQGRSAVLIQTWERRTQWESYSKLRRDCKCAPKNRFGGKENTDANSTAMPDSYICTKYKGSLPNGDYLLESELVPRVRGVSSHEAMLYRTAEEQRRRVKEPLGTVTNGGVVDNGNSSAQEPEWISLSRKLCAKFVEGHIGPHNSTDSYPFEEPEGVIEEVKPSPPPPNLSGSSSGELLQKRRLVPAPFSDESGGRGSESEPPWIHLSRKLCTKFIEEHIEYPPITNGHFVEVPELIEPNGDVRIIEKIGKPKVSKSKKKKESEPEWVSLSKKLRAKFIESHIDDPETIALDNQLNASDPEETGSETLSDVSQEISVPKENRTRLEAVECKNFSVRSHVIDNGPIFQDRECQPDNEECTLFPAKECCWEYQEMEFDQESNSGNFQDAEYFNEPLQEARVHRGSLPQDSSNQFEECNQNSSMKDNLHEVCLSQNLSDPLTVYNDSLEESNIHRRSFPQDNSEQLAEPVTFSCNGYSRSSQNPECFNNCVRYVPSSHEDETTSDTQEHNKFITVQFIAHRDSNDGREYENGKHHFHAKNRENGPNFATQRSDQYSEHHISENVPYNSKGAESDSVFNKSMWKEERYNENINDKLDSQNLSLKKNFISKSLDNLCDSLEDSSVTKNDKFENVSLRNSMLALHHVNTEDRVQFNTENFINKEENETFFNHYEQDLQSAQEIFSVKENIKSAADDAYEIENTVLNSKTSFHHQKENMQDAESSSDDEVFESERRSHKLSSNTSETHYGKIYNGKKPISEKGKIEDHEQISSVKIKNNHENKNGKNIKCNGMIPNSIYDRFPDSGSSSSKCNTSSNSQKPKSDNKQDKAEAPVKLGMSKWITISKSEQNINRPEYSNLKSVVQRESKTATKSSNKELDSKKRSKKKSNENEADDKISSYKNISPRSARSQCDCNNAVDFGREVDRFNGFSKEHDLKSKCKSLCDISSSNNLFPKENGFKHHESVADLCTGRNTPQIEFQHFEFESEIPLCAKLVSNHDKKMLSKNEHSTRMANWAVSPSPSASSHVYEDMFKETPSGPSDSEASSWIAKNNTYYINGRSSSMNDLDFSDSCSMSVKCDYASSSENSTLQSRHSSYASSSFYVNLRDYDSHMLEPALNKKKSSNGKLTNNGTFSSISKSNPPTPESLRHLFTSPLSSIHSPPNRAPRLLSRMPSDPQSHYYSTAAATSSAFKHGFDLTPPKPKKAERSSSIKIKDIAHGIILTFKRFQNHSKNTSLPSAQHVDVSHLAEMKSNSELGKTDKSLKNSKKTNHDKGYSTENMKTDSDSGFVSDAQRAKARRSSSDLTGMKSKSELFHLDKKKGKSSKKNNSRDKGKKSRSKASEPRTVPTVSRKVQQMADGTLYLVTTVSGDTALPGVYSDSPDTSSELSGHNPVKSTGESNC